MHDLKQRYLFIDLLRFVAAFLMIQGHVFDAVLSPQAKAHPYYYLHDFFHGFVAPAFLFASGVAYGAATMRRWEEHIAWGKRMRDRLTRFLGLIAIGYALHLPYFSLRKTINEASPGEIQSFLQSDVLQCIGLTLLLLQIAIFLVKNRKAFEWGVAGAAAGVIFLAPYTWSAQLSGSLPTALVSFLTPENGSWFPLFPWAGYILCGVLFGCFLVDVRDNAQARQVMLRSMALSAGTLLVAWAVMYLPVDLYPAHDFWKANPTMFFVRLSAVSLVAGGLFLLERWVGLIPDVPLILGRESLFIYVLHLLIVYGSVLNRGLAQLIGPSLPTLQTTGVFAAVFAAITLTTVLWYKFKTTQKAAAKWITVAVALLFFEEFIRRPW